MRPETTFSNIEQVANALFIGQTSSPVSSNPHAVYFQKLDEQSRELLRVRDAKYEGNWDALTRVVSSTDRFRIGFMRAYEDSHHVDLGQYLRESA